MVPDAFDFHGDSLLHHATSLFVKTVQQGSDENNDKDDPLQATVLQAICKFHCKLSNINGEAKQQLIASHSNLEEMKLVVFKCMLANQQDMALLTINMGQSPGHLLPPPGTTVPPPLLPPLLLAMGTLLMPPLPLGDATFCHYHHP